jgi:DNA-directed RNA polymerase specialized sigma24 family protein
MTSGQNCRQDVSSGRYFATTHWSVVLAAKDRQHPVAHEAMERLCRTYWPPLYAFIRREGYGGVEAKDLTQEFFLRLIDRDILQRLRHQQGKFRSFLLTFLKHFLLEERGKGRAQKRGGGAVFVPLENLNEEGGYLDEPVNRFSPEQVFERRWAQAIYQETVTRLAREYADAGKEEFFETMKDFQPRQPGALSYAEIGTRFHMSEAG